MIDTESHMLKNIPPHNISFFSYVSELIQISLHVRHLEKVKLLG